MLKIIMLDFDGVINSRKFDKSLPASISGLAIDPKVIKILNEILQEDESINIVITSSWSKNHDIHKLVDDLEAKGLIKNRVIDSIDINLKKADGIEKWVESNNPDSFCIIDDEWLFSIDHPYQKNFVKINSLSGMSENYLDLILAILF